MSNGWDDSASAWINAQGESGDFTRAHVLDAPMLARIRAARPKTALDVGCGEGRFCRMLRADSVGAIGLDPTAALITEARVRDPDGSYVEGRAEALPFTKDSFDAVVSYLSLIDIPDFRAGLAEMARVLAPGGVLLIANLTGFTTARVMHADAPHPPSDAYLDEFFKWEEWKGIRIQNWHRPLSAYMQTLLSLGLTLTHFDEPAPHSGQADRIERYRRAPYALIMEWRKSA